MENEERAPVEMERSVPTYNCLAYPDEVERGELGDHDNHRVPVLIHESEALRVVLGTHEYEDCDKPALFIERQPNGWLIMLYPEGRAGEPSGYVFFLDNGDSYLMRDDVSSIQVLRPGNERPYLLNVPPIASGSNHS